jgi:prevent-host-death family protein
MKKLSKSSFKLRALDYFREVEATGQEIVITDRGRPVVRIVPFRPGVSRARKELRGSVIRYDDPTEPVAVEEWESPR